MSPANSHHQQQCAPRMRGTVLIALGLAPRASANPPSRPPHGGRGTHTNHHTNLHIDEFLLSNLYHGRFRCKIPSSDDKPRHPGIDTQNDMDDSRGSWQGKQAPCNRWYRRPYTYPVHVVAKHRIVRPSARGEITLKPMDKRTIRRRVRMAAWIWCFQLFAIFQTQCSGIYRESGGASPQNQFQRRGTTISDIL